MDYNRPYLKRQKQTTTINLGRDDAGSEAESLESQESEGTSQKKQVDHFGLEVALFDSN